MVDDDLGVVSVRISGPQFVGLPGGKTSPAFLDENGHGRYPVELFATPEDATAVQKTGASLFSRLVGSSKGGAA